MIELCGAFISGKISVFEFRREFLAMLEHMNEEDLRDFASLIYSEWMV